MSSTWRWTNRALLLVCGLLLVAAGGAVLVPADRVNAAARWSTDRAAGLLDVVGIPDGGIPDVGGLPGEQAAALVAAVLLLVLLLVFLRTRGGGRTPTVVRLEATDGRTAVDEGVARALLADPLAERADVLSARTGAHRVKGAPAICLTVIVRRGADLAGVLAAAEAALAEWDELAGVRVPVLVHLADRRWRDGLHARTRVR